jgi:hypothetical protein
MQGFFSELKTAPKRRLHTNAVRRVLVACLHVETLPAARGGAELEASAVTLCLDLRGGFVRLHKQ